MPIGAFTCYHVADNDPIATWRLSSVPSTIVTSFAGSGRDGRAAVIGRPCWTGQWAGVSTVSSLGFRWRTLWCSRDPASSLTAWQCLQSHIRCSNAFYALLRLFEFIADAGESWKETFCCKTKINTRELGDQRRPHRASAHENTHICAQCSRHKLLSSYWIHLISHYCLKLLSNYIVTSSSLVYRATHTQRSREQYAHSHKHHVFTNKLHILDFLLLLCTTQRHCNLASLAKYRLTNLCKHSFSISVAQ